MNDVEKNHQKLESIRKACIENAESLLSVAERELSNGVNHICFHLGLLALEEVGKLILATISHTTTTVGHEKPGLINDSDDHKKKIFWAIWGGKILRDTKYTKESIESSLDLANTLHERRIESLYTSTDNPLSVDERVENKEAKMIVEFARTRLELEKTQELVDFDGADVELLSWYFNAVEDVEKRKHIFASISLKKLAEVDNGKEWMRWLKETFDKNEEEMRELAQQELQRKKPEEEKDKPKYRMRIRIQTPSHSIRGNAFVKWNEGVDNIKMYQSSRKDAKKITKGEILIDFTFSKSVPIHALWEHGLFMSKTLVIGMNVATLGVFWWHVNKDIEKYYEYIKDLEADPKEGVSIVVAPQKRLHVNFDEAKLVLDERAMSNVYHVIVLLFRESEKLKDFLEAYSMGLTLFSKTDIHLRLEVNSFEEFRKALKSAMRAFGDWDGTSDFKGAVKEQFKKIGEMKDLDKILSIGEKLEADTKREKHHPITLTETIAMKIYCDYYLQLKAREYFEEIKDEEDLITNK